MKILFAPFSLLYALVIHMRNFCYDRKILPSTSFRLPVIAVGNLRLGGTGKTPMVAFLVEKLKPRMKVAVLSRGYGRKTTGWKLVSPDSQPEDVGDEPLMISSKHKEITVAVMEDRRAGVKHLLDMAGAPEVILLDDAMQHRAVRPGMLIMLSAYHKLYLDDMILPAGRLREPRSEANRADIIVITKCPPQLDIHTRRSLRERIHPMPHQAVVFAYEEHGSIVHIVNGKELESSSLQRSHVLLVTGIADTTRLVEWIENHTGSWGHIAFGDHHVFTESDMLRISVAFNQVQDEPKIILTTEKDACRMRNWLLNEKFADMAVYSLSHRMEIFREDRAAFDTKLNEFIKGY